MAQQTVFTLADLVAPAVDVADLKHHLRVDSDDDDALIGVYGIAATRTAEQFMQRTIVQRAAELRLLEWRCGSFALPMGAASGVAVTGADDGAITAFGLTVGPREAVVTPHDGWPAPDSASWPVSITYVSGPDVVPPEWRVAVMMITAQLYDNRSGGAEGGGDVIPPAARSLLLPHRILPR